MRRGILGLFVLLALPAAAADRTFVDYKGRLLAGGLPVTTPTTLTFRLCRAGDPTTTLTCGGGVTLYQEALLVTPDATGTFSTRIGSGGTGIASSVLDTTVALTLEVQVGSELLLPRPLLQLGRDTAGSTAAFEMTSVSGKVARGLLSVQGSLRVAVPAGSTASAALWLSQNNVPADNGIWALAARGTGTPGHAVFYNQGGNRDVLTMLPSGDVAALNGNVGFGTAPSSTDRLAVGGPVSVGGTTVINAAGNWAGLPADLPGAMGNAGMSGPRGQAGLKGDPGVGGQLGTSGPTGVTGTQGQMGAAGGTGAMGHTGPTGPTGTGGVQGATGVRQLFTVCRSANSLSSCGCSLFPLYDSGTQTQNSCTASLGSQTCTITPCPSCFPSPQVVRCCVCTS